MLKYVRHRMNYRGVFKEASCISVNNASVLDYVFENYSLNITVSENRYISFILRNDDGVALDLLIHRPTKEYADSAIFFIHGLI